MLGGSPVNAQRTPGLYDGLYNTSGLCERESSTEVPGNRGKALIVDNHHMIGEGDQEAAIEAFLAAHEGHTQEVEVQRRYVVDLLPLQALWRHTHLRGG